jgi:hypothetical protein
VTRLRDGVGLVVSPEVFFDLRRVFTLGGLIVRQLRPVTTSQLTPGSRIARRDHLAHRDRAPHGEPVFSRMLADAW